MSMLDRLVKNYESFVQLPWATSLPSKQRVWFAVYPPSEERQLRILLPEFESATITAKHTWHLLDITAEPAAWISRHEYREGLFAEPSAMTDVEEEMRSSIISAISGACQADKVTQNSVVAVLGAASLFGFTHVSGVMFGVEEAIRGRLLLFFPGSFERNIYRFMDARDGFNYMAVPITCDERISR
jgi:hypothetical protein